jgi:hypothetical protein
MVCTFYLLVLNVPYPFASATQARIVYSDMEDLKIFAKDSDSPEANDSPDSDLKRPLGSGGVGG